MKKTLYCQQFVDQGILQIKDIVNVDGSIKTFHDLTRAYDIHDNQYLYYLGIKNSIPKAWTKIIENQIADDVEHTCTMIINNCKHNLKGLVKKHLYRDLIILKKEYSRANMQYTKKYNIGSEQWKACYMLPFTLKVSNKVKENNFKILNNYLANNKLLFKMKVLDIA